MRRVRYTITAAIFGLTLAATGFVARPAIAEPRTYVLDPTHLTIAFLVTHVGFAKTLGIFKTAEGSFDFDEQAPSVSDIQIKIPTASVFTNDDGRDNHLRSADFLAAEQYPTITFEGTSAQQTGPRTGTITGDLTMRGVTKPVTLDVTWNKSGEYPFGDKHYAVGVSARTMIKRSDFGMTYALAGGLVSDEVEIMLEFEAIRQP
jgi:Uncharacterized conserved protein